LDDVQNPDGGYPESDAEQPAGNREDAALGQQLANDCGFSGTERHTDRQFAAPGGGPRKHQVREVGAGDEQDQEDRAAQHIERGAKVPGQTPLQRFGEDAEGLEEAFEFLGYSARTDLVTSGGRRGVALR